MESKSCEQCGEVFARTRANETDGSWAIRKYCSTACFYKTRKKWIPSPDQLVEMYDIERMSISDISNRISLSYASTRKALLDAGIQLRSPSNGIENRGGVAPTKDQLFALYHNQNFSKPKIAEMLGIPKSGGAGVNYWFKKFGIPPRDGSSVVFMGNRGTRPTKDELADMLGGNLTLGEIASRCSLSAATVARTCDQYGIARPESGYTRRTYPCQDGTKVKSTYEQKVSGWLTKRKIPYEYEPRIGLSRRHRCDFLANGWYIEVWGMGVAGGSRYLVNREKKTKFYKDHNYPLLELLHGDFAPSANGRWARKLEKCLESPEITASSTSGYQLSLF